MLRFVVVLCVAASALAAPGGGHYEYGYHQKHCHTKYNIKYDQKCDTIVDTTYIEKCEDIVTQHCSETHTQVHKSSHVVGHDSYKVHGGYHKRDAEPGYGGHGYSSGPHCKQNVQKQCHKVPHQNSRKIPRQVCNQIEIKVPYEVCGSSYVHRNQYANGYGSYH